MFYPTIKLIAVALGAGFVGNAISGILFTLPITTSILYNPALQSDLFLEITPLRNIPLSVVGLIVLSIIPTYLFVTLRTAVPGADWVKKGLFWGLVIWGMFWVMQEWFVYYTLLQEPLPLALFELLLLLPGALAQGLAIAYFYKT